MFTVNGPLFRMGVRFLESDVKILTCASRVNRIRKKVEETYHNTPKVIEGNLVVERAASRLRDINH